MVEFAGRGQVGQRVTEVVDSESVLAGFPEETSDEEGGLQASCDSVYQPTCAKGYRKLRPRM